ncbi:MAG: protein TolR [Gammaproteobacteria bacterium SHHR-1]|uniref:protein TolR n=1 Tax=Magnetovirga frankeli TaxID=947516 RepID=UPI001AF7CCD3|nr:protein TolR [gamma proteobacterium SS-5]
MSRRKNSRKPMAQINVVPYIDVMLVLLVIFMITAPLITQGVSVELPQADAEPMQQDQQEPLIVTVDQQGQLYIDVGQGKQTPISPEQVQLRVAAVLRNQPKTPILVRGDRAVDYGSVVQAMVLLQAAGAPSVGLITESPN